MHEIIHCFVLFKIALRQAHSQRGAGKKLVMIILCCLIIKESNTYCKFMIAT